MITIFIPGEPPRVTAQMKKTFSVGGRVRHVDSDILKAAKGYLMEKVMPFRPQTPLQGPIAIRIRWVFPHTVSAPKKRRGMEIYKDTSPDLDNMEKALLDCLQKVEFFGNDGQIAKKISLKYWGPDPGITIDLKELKD